MSSGGGGGKRTPAPHPSEGTAWVKGGMLPKPVISARLDVLQATGQGTTLQAAASVKSAAPPPRITKKGWGSCRACPGLIRQSSGRADATKVVSARFVALGEAVPFGGFGSTRAAVNESAGIGAMTISSTRWWSRCSGLVWRTICKHRPDREPRWETEGRTVGREGVQKAPGRSDVAESGRGGGGLPWLAPEKLGAALARAGWRGSREGVRTPSPTGQ